MGFQIVVMFIDSFMDDDAYHVKTWKRFICSHVFNFILVLLFPLVLICLGPMDVKALMLCSVVKFREISCWWKGK